MFAFPLPNTFRSTSILAKPVPAKRAYAAFSLVLALELAACGGGGGDGAVPSQPSPVASPAPPPPPEPQYIAPIALGDGWQVDAASVAGIDETRLAKMLDDIRSGLWTNIDGVAVARRGTLVLDETLRTALAPNDAAAGNDNLALHRVYSVTKSVTATLVGIAMAQGLIGSVDNALYPMFPAYSPFANWDERKAQTTIEDFLTMQHGLDWDELTYPFTDARNSLTVARAQCTDYIKCLLDLPLSTHPGTAFTYSTHVTHTLGALVATQSDESLPAFAEQHLLGPLQIREHLWSPASPTGRALAGSGLFLTVRDMAKLGQLYLADGIWGDTQVVSPEWVAAASAHQANLPPAFGTGYGYQWWRFTLDNAGTPVDTYAAIGWGGQYVIVIEEFDLVIAFAGANYGASDRQDQALEIVTTYLLPALMD